MSVAKGARKPKAKPDPYPPGWEPFLAAINANLDADVPRLMFADWLQENGDEARAEFIRIQCAMEQCDYSRDREADVLLRDNKSRWCLGLPKWVFADLTHFRYRRGFLAGISTTGARYAEAAECLRRLAALETLELNEPTIESVTHPGIAGIRTLRVENTPAPVSLALAESPALSDLRELRLTAHWRDRVNEEAVRPVLATGRLTKLARLAITHIAGGDVLASALLTAYPNARFEELDLSATGLTGVGATDLVNSPVLEQVRELRLLWNPIGLDGVRAIIASPYLKKLNGLHLNCTGLTEEAIELLSKWEGLRNIQSLSIYQIGSNHSAWERKLRDSPYATNLVTVM